jgi:hypothetical protein
MGQIREGHPRIGRRAGVGLDPNGQIIGIVETPDLFGNRVCLAINDARRRSAVLGRADTVQKPRYRESKTTSHPQPGAAVTRADGRAKAAGHAPTRSRLTGRRRSAAACRRVITPLAVGAITDRRAPIEIIATRGYGHWALAETRTTRNSTSYRGSPRPEQRVHGGGAVPPSRRTSRCRAPSGK